MGRIKSQAGDEVPASTQIEIDRITDIFQEKIDSLVERLEKFVTENRDLRNKNKM